MELSRYQQLRDEFEALQRTCESLRDEGVRIYHQIVWAPEFEEWSDEEFGAFRDHYDSDELWERWELWPDRRAANRFHGADGARLVDEASRIAERGCSILEGFLLLKREGMGCPSEVLLDLPGMTDAGHWRQLHGRHGWWELLHETARKQETPNLKSGIVAWGCDDNWTEDVRSKTQTTNGITFRLHPACNSLQNDVFTSSAELVTVSTGTDPVVQTNYWDGDPLVFLLPERVVPVWDGKELWFGGKLIKSFSKPAENQRMLLTVFQEDDWPEVIDSPFSPSAGDPIKKLKDTRRALMQDHVTTGMISFSEVNQGEGIRWECVADN